MACGRGALHNEAPRGGTGGGDTSMSHRRERVSTAPPGPECRGALADTRLTDRLEIR